jgi:methyl-accepting chemotaxis protein
MVQDIGKISAGIDSILQLSDQTRLLSFNASIESARAGSAGSGFKVVSAEIRKLSEHVDVTVKSISTMLKETLNRISSLMILFDESSSRLDQLFKNFETVLTSTGSLISSLEVEDFGDESKAGFSDQDERIQKLQSELASLIRLNTDINQVMKSIQIQSVSNLENVDKLSESMDRLFIDNESIENLIAHHAGQIEELNQEIRQFRLE